MSSLILRLEELRRRMDGAPKELAAWRDRSQRVLDLNAHSSQLNAIETLMKVFFGRQREAFDALDPDGDTQVFAQQSLELVRASAKAQRAWDFFREKLDLRLSPELKDALWTADTIAWDCHRPALDRAVQFGVIAADALREPPLTYLSAEYSPLTWVRGNRPNDGRSYALGEALLPIPVIEMPWDHLENLWELLSIPHEVGHDLEADLKLRRPLQAALEETLTAAGVPSPRQKVWKTWQPELFADLVALQLVGPAFADCLFHLLILPAPAVVIYDSDDDHPTPYLRLLLNADYLGKIMAGSIPDLGLEGARIETEWKAIYAGAVPASEQARFAELRADFPVVAATLMATSMAALGGHSVSELIPFTPGDHARIQSCSQYLQTGFNAPGPINPRHVVSASRMAARASGGDAAALESVQTRTAELIREKAAPGLRASDDSEPHRKFVANFADLVPF